MKEYIPINRRNKDERPREKLLAYGAEILTDAELIAILINNGTRNKSAIDLAKEALAITKKVNGKKGADYIIRLSILAGIYNKKGNYQTLISLHYSRNNI